MNFESYDEFRESLSRGNEIQFLFDKELYYIHPHWNVHTLDGYVIGKCYGDSFVVVSADSLDDYLIQGVKFVDAFSLIEIVDRVF